MHFQRLRLSGFKSFVDPTEMRIEDGLTGIVGPNGCGKSNLLEALRWVMGESSAKSMRGGDMEDVIFAGTTQRPSRNFADVALLLDNRDRRAPAQFNEHEEIEVSRRIERESGSAYRVNGRDVRQKDVQLLFADAATGAHSPALVSQGRIGAIVTSKPTDRRAILEEAAGISGLHARRKEAEQRLRAAEGNITRLDDVMGQMEGQLAALKRQSRQAERYRALSEDIRRAEAILLYQRWTEAAQKLAESEAQLKAIDAEVATLTRASAQLATEQATLAADLPALRQSEAEAAAACQRLTIARDELAAEEKRITERHQQLTRQLEDIARDRGREDALAADGAAALARLATERAEIATRLEAETVRESAAREAVAEAEAAASTAERLFDELTQRNAETVARKRALDAQADAARQRIARLNEDLGRIAQEKARLEAEAMNDGGLGETQATVAAAEAALKDIAERIGRAEQERGEADAARQRIRAESETARDAARARAEAEREAVRARTETERRAAAEALEAAREAATRARREAEASVTSLKSELATLDRLLAARQNSGGGTPVIDLLTVEPGYEAALGAALAEDLNAPVGGEAKRRWSEAAVDASTDAPLPAGTRALAALVQAPAALTRRLRQIAVVDDAAAALALVAQLKVGQRLVTRDGKLWRWDGFHAAAPASASEQERLAQRNRRAVVATDLDAAQARLSQVTEEGTTALAEAQTRQQATQAAGSAAIAEADARAKEIIAEAQARLETAVAHAQARLDAAVATEKAARSERVTQEAALDQARRRLAQLQQEATRRDTRLQGLNDTQRRLNEEMTARETDRAAAQAAVAALPDVEALGAEVGEQRRVVERHRADLATARAALDTLLRQLQADARRIEAIDVETAAWDSRLASGQQQADILRERETQAREELTAIEARPAQIADQRNRLIDQLAEAESRRQNAADALAHAEGALKSKDAEVRQTSEALAQAREIRGRLEAGVENYSARRQELALTVGEQFQCPPPFLLHQLGIPADEALPPIRDLETQLDRQRGERERLGAVNLRADIELQELDAQRETMATERAELETAIAKLRASIGTLNREGRTRLLEAFTAVNAHFSELFTTLFGGGQAHLELIESDDPLEAGLEIMASPPGKRLQSLSLLSGGEQALTACALIFAVFLTNPSPICVLDEVDAPLDDANVERFCDLLVEMTRKTETRFLVVTHNAVTMSRMDRLYGVTMAERGVSQLVSVDLRHAELLLAAE
ncbi:AAA family ATPase [Parapedomonas caeni]